MCDQSAEQQRDGLSGRQELAMSTLRCRRGLPYGVKSLHSGEDREYHVRVGVPNRKFWSTCPDPASRSWAPREVAGRGCLEIGQGSRACGSGGKP